MIFFKRTLPVLICFLVGITFLVQYYVPTHASNEALRYSANWVKVVIGFSYLIGLQSLVHLHWSRIKRRQQGWGYSSLVFVGLVPMLVFGFSGELSRFVQLVFGVNANLSLGQTFDAENKGSAYNWMFNYLFTPAQETMFSLLAFFIASAAYRTFRAKTIESALLLVAALLVIFGRVPISAAISGWFPAVADWIMAYPNLAVKRGIMIGVSLGIVGTALRVIFGLERAYIGGD